MSKSGVRLSATPYVGGCFSPAGARFARSQNSLWCGSATGETCRELIARGKSVWNVYGPPRLTAVHVYRVTAERRLDPDRPSPREYLDLSYGFQAKPRAVNVAGEIYIGGTGLRAAPTPSGVEAERFVPKPGG